MTPQNAHTSVLWGVLSVALPKTVKPIAFTVIRPLRTALESGVYPCTIADIEQVYDGDTISRVRILVQRVDLSTLERLGEVFPNVVLDGDGVYVQNGIRIAKIDTPEMRPSTKKRDGTVRSEVSRENERKAARANARDAVRTLLEGNDLAFTIKRG